MPTSPTPPTPADDVTFVCAVSYELMRRACRRESFYKEHDGKLYCVLHYPGTEKEEDFEKALKQKLDNKDFNFQGVWFPDAVSFENYTFSAAADFRFAEFSAVAYFNGAQFSAAADFSFAQFRMVAKFDDAVFNHTVSFYRTQFTVEDSSDTDDTCSTRSLQLEVSFARASFKEGVNFEENGFAERVFMSFAAAIFEKPERVTFHTTSLRPHWFINIDSRKFTFINVNWGRYAIGEELLALSIAGRESRQCLLDITYRQLAVNAEENNRYEEAAHFRYMAMEVKRRQRQRSLDLFRLGWWYWLLSGYGERVTRAFGMLITIWLLFAVIYSRGDATWWQPKQSAGRVAQVSAPAQPSTVGRATPAASAVAPMPLSEAAVYSAYVMSLQKPEPLPATMLAKLIVLFEMILGPLQAALLALAIRRKFMR